MVMKLAYEILVGTSMVVDLIKKGSILEIKDEMEKSDNVGMQTIDSVLVKLYQDGRISKEIAIKNADSESNVRLKIDLASGGQHAKLEDGGGSSFGGLSLLARQEDENEDDEVSNKTRFDW